MKHREYAAALKQAALARLAAGESVAAVARDLQLRGRLLYAWRDKVRKGGPAALRGLGRPRKRAAAVAGPAACEAGETGGARTSWRGRNGGSPRWSARSASNRSIWIFFGEPCGM